MSDEEAVAEGLAEVLQPVLGPVSIQGLARLTAGANRETWRFDAVSGEHVHELVLQRDRAGLDRALGSCAREAEVLRRARAHHVPVAEVSGSGNPPGPLERSFSINRRLPGETIARRLQRDDEWSRARERFVGDCATALARIHRLGAEDMDGIDLPEVRDVLIPLEATYLALDDPHPAFDLAVRWLEQHRPEPLPSSLVHGDFRLGNLILDHDGLVAALDWEGTHLGDPGEDLGWLCVRAWRFGGAQPVGGMGTREELLEAYQRAGGADVAPETLRWWEIFGTLRWGVICLQLGGDFRAGRTGSVEMAVIGRRVAENEHDLLELLA